MEKTKNFAGFWIRHIALFIDMMIILIALFPIAYAIAYFWIDNNYQSISWIIVWLILDLIWFFYFACFHHYFWQTPWKMLVWVKVVNKDFGKLTFLQAIWRSFATILSTLPLWLWYAWAWWDAKKRTFHDLLAQTLVIEENAIWKKWVIFWNILIFILFILLTMWIVMLFMYAIENPEVLMQLELWNL